MIDKQFLLKQGFAVYPTTSKNLCIAMKPVEVNTNVNGSIKINMLNSINFVELNIDIPRTYEMSVDGERVTVYIYKNDNDNNNTQTIMFKFSNEDLTKLTSEFFKKMVKLYIENILGDLKFPFNKDEST